MNMLNAKEAQEITSSALGSRELLNPYLGPIENKIRLAASKGKSEIHHPFANFVDYPSQEIQDAVRKFLESMGYKWTDHLNPDPEDTRSHPYCTISW